MPAINTPPEARGGAFLPVVISSIGTSAGLLILLASFATDTSGGDPVARDVFVGVRWVAAGLTVLCALLLAASLSTFAGRGVLLRGKLAAIVAMTAALILVALLVRTMVI